MMTVPRASRVPAGLFQDVRYSLRTLARNWGLIAIAVFSLVASQWKSSTTASTVCRPATKHEHFL